LLKNQYIFGSVHKSAENQDRDGILQEKQFVYVPKYDILMGKRNCPGAPGRGIGLCPDGCCDSSRCPCPGGAENGTVSGEFLMEGKLKTWKKTASVF
jgi:hypothetical protein